ncbi:MAG TPA: hypothetical protein VHU13_06210 [Solirubrobacteraceae bacterium]|nr:hypothetical protein [Solirubrobacteraceae bacterium]
MAPEGRHFAVIALDGAKRGLSQNDQQAPAGIRLLDALPGTTGYGDLARNSVRMQVDGIEGRVAALVDLLRVAHSESTRYSRRFARAYDETLRLTERLGQSPGRDHRRKLTDPQAREEVKRWLERQNAA